MAHSSDSEKSVFLSHIVSQVENDVGFLARQGYISQEDASSFLAKLPRSNTLAHASVPTFPTPIPTPHAAAFSSTHASAVPRARVLWAWTGQVQLQSDRFHSFRLTPHRTLETSISRKETLLISLKRPIKIGGLDESLTARDYFLRTT